MNLHKEMMERYELGMKEFISKLEILNHDYNSTNHYQLMEHINSRIKTIESIKNKLHKNNLPFTPEGMTQLNDIAGVRVVVAFEEDVYLVKDLVQKIKDIKIVLEKDYIHNPKDSGYSSYHMILDVPTTFSTGVEYVRIELQIRTLMMDAWANIEHKMVYKKQSTMDTITMLKTCSAEMMDLDSKFTDLRNNLQNKE